MLTHSPAWANAVLPLACRVCPGARAAGPRSFPVPLSLRGCSGRCEDDLGGRLPIRVPCGFLRKHRRKPWWHRHVPVSAGRYGGRSLLWLFNTRGHGLTHVGGDKLVWKCRQCFMMASNTIWGRELHLYCGFSTALGITKNCIG